MMVMETWLILLFWLLVVHCLADYALQGDFMAKAKNHTASIPGVPWMQALGAHALIHGGFVAAVTGSVVLGLAEVVCHAVIDYGKSAGWYEFGGRWIPNGPHSVYRRRCDTQCVARKAYHIDQLLHVTCKVVWVLICVVAS